MNFSEFSNNNIKYEENQTSFSEDKVKESYEQLKNLPKDELSKRLFEEVNKQKNNGSFNYEMLEASVESIKSLIPKESYENLKRILKTIK